MSQSPDKKTNKSAASSNISKLRPFVEERKRLTNAAKPPHLSKLLNEFGGGSEVRKDWDSKNKRQQAADESTAQLLGELVQEYAPDPPPITNEAIEQLGLIIERAQRVSPPDKKRFVRDVMRVMDEQQLRFITENNGRPASLCINKVSIAFSLGGAKGTLGFRRDFAIVERETRRVRRDFQGIQTEGFGAKPRP